MVPKKCTNPLLGASSCPRHQCPTSPRTALLPAAPRAGSAAATSSTSSRAQLAGCKMLMGSSLPAATSSVAAFLLLARFGILRSLRRSRSLQILGCFLPSFLTVRNQRPGEKTILSANYHDYPIMAILDEFLMKCALVSSGFHNFQVQLFHPSDLLHKDFFSPAKERSASGREGGTLASRNLAAACQNRIKGIC